MTNDLDALQGTWTLAGVEVDGMLMTGALIDGAVVVVEGDQFRSLGMGGSYEGTIEIDQSASPRHFDLVITGGHAAGTRNLGIYELAGDRWTLCLATRGTERPATFATQPDTGLALETLVRRSPARPSKAARPASKAARTATSAAPPAPVLAAPGAATPPGDVTELEGEWAMTAGVFNGAAMSESMVAWARRTTRGNVTTVTAGPQVMLAATFSIDPSRTPRAVDYMNTAGSNKGKPQAGIMERDGDSLRLCMSPPGVERPADFASHKGDHRSFTTWRLINP